MNSFAEAKVGLHLGEPKAFTLQSSLYALENCFADAKVFLRLGEAVPLILGSAFLSFSPLLNLLSILEKLKQMRD